MNPEVLALSHKQSWTLALQDRQEGLYLVVDRASWDWVSWYTTEGWYSGLGKGISQLSLIVTECLRKSSLKEDRRIWAHGCRHCSSWRGPMTLGPGMAEHHVGSGA